jgi:hypothetical protein
VGSGQWAEAVSGWAVGSGQKGEIRGQRSGQEATSLAAKHLLDCSVARVNIYYQIAAAPTHSEVSGQWAVGSWKKPAASFFGKVSPW